VTTLLFFGAFVVVGAVVALVSWYASEGQRTIRRLRAHVHTPIGDAVDGGSVKLDGTVRLLEERFRAPISGRECALYHVVIRELRQSGKSSRWVTLVDDRRGGDFLLEDETGRALVRASEPRLDLAIVMDAHKRSGALHGATPELEEVLRRYGQSSSGVFGRAKDLRYEEGVLEEGERAVVLGVSRWELDPDPSATAGYRGKARRLVVAAPPGDPLLVSDAPDSWGSS